jgi:hypothetical protein
MDKLEALISEALQKFPSEDIRELVAKETGLTVEQVSEKMNEVAKAAGDNFPAENFALFETKSAITPKHSVGDVDGDEEYDTEADKAIVANKVEAAVDTNKDGKITYKIGYLPEPSSHNTDWSEFGSTELSDVPLETKTAKIGITVADALKGYDYDRAFTTYYKYVNGTYEYTTSAVDEKAANTLSDLSNFGDIYYADDTFLADGSVILLYKGAADEAN